MKQKNRPEKFADLDSEFKPSLVNSTVYIISLSLQVSTFAINHKGHPFMESLKENKPLLYSIIFSASAAVGLACRTLPDLNEQFQIVDFPDEVKRSFLFTDLIQFTDLFVIQQKNSFAQFYWARFCSILWLAFWWTGFSSFCSEIPVWKKLEWTILSIGYVLCVCEFFFLLLKLLRIDFFLLFCSK